MALALALALALSGCGDESESGGVAMANTVRSSVPGWRTLTERRVVFGHQSVGDNILRGIEYLAAQEGVSIVIREQRGAPAAAGISHFRIGRNGDATAKMREFAAAIDAGAGDGADVALMKLCYADIGAGTDARQLAGEYIATLDALAERHPQTAFVAVTVPLMSVQTGPKAWLKPLLGKQPYGRLDNVRRSEFNTALRERYLSSGRLFDLARAESEYAGKKCLSRVDGRTVEALCPELAADGGHLNAHGQALAATALLNVLNAVFKPSATDKGLNGA